jgi:hypothetical protein
MEDDRMVKNQPTGNHLGKDPSIDGSMESSKIWKCSR